MSPKLLTCIALLLLLMGCHNKVVPKDQYNAGWKKAEDDACNCNENLVQIDNSEAAKAGWGWADGYIKGCKNYRKEMKCK